MHWYPAEIQHHHGFDFRESYSLLLLKYVRTSQRAYSTAIRAVYGLSTAAQPAGRDRKVVLLTAKCAAVLVNFLAKPSDSSRIPTDMFPTWSSFSTLAGPSKIRWMRLAAGPRQLTNHSARDRWRPKRRLYSSRAPANDQTSPVSCTVAQAHGRGSERPCHPKREGVLCILPRGNLTA